MVPWEKEVDHKRGQIFHAPRHPYTRGKKKKVPHSIDSQRRGKKRKGAAPLMIDLGMQRENG